MASLIAKSATEGLLPISIGTLTLRDASPGRLTAVAPYPGQAVGVGKALKKMGLGWPAANRAVTNGDAACLRSGRDQAFLVNADASGLEGAALTDISDGWVGLCFEGVGAAETLARLVPLDLGAKAFPEGATARTGLGHMMVLIHRSGAQVFTLYVFRSMVTTAAHEIETAMKALTARAKS